MKLFCFGRLEGRFKIEGLQIIFDSPVQFEIRSASDMLIDAVVNELLNRKFVRLGNSISEITDLKIEERLFFQEEMRINLRSPVTVHKTTEDGRTYYFSPDEAEWSERLASNLCSKLKALHLDIVPDFSIISVDGKPKKQVVKFKDTIITGYLGKFRIKANPEAIKALYYCGLGNRNSQGFGLFDIIF